MRHTLTIIYLLAIVAGITSCKPSAQSSQAGTVDQPKLYTVNRTVAQFPMEEDFSTPETAYVAINRIIATGTRADWFRISLKGYNPPSQEVLEKIDQDERNALLNANVLEVKMNTKGMAVVIAEVDDVAESPIETRTLILEDERWVGVGNSQYGTMEQARKSAKLRLSKWWPIRYQISKLFRTRG